MNILPNNPIWVLVQHDDDTVHRTTRSFVRLTQSGPVVSGLSLLDCSKWNSRSDALTAVGNRDNIFVYRVDEFEDGSGRYLIKLTKEN